MATINTNVTNSSGDAYTIYSADPLLVVEQTGAVVSLGGYALQAAQEVPTYLVDVTVDGLLYGSIAGFWFHDNGGTMTIGATGQVRGGLYGIVVYNSAYDPDISISNAGQVVGDTGIITGFGNDRVINTGTIQGTGTFSVRLQYNDDKLVNAGAIIGKVALGDGNDAFVAKPGGTVTGAIDGGSGDDTFVIRDGSLTLVGGSGTDTVKSFVTHSLESDIENLTLLGSGIINGTGNAMGNTVTGNNAANVLKGLGGADTLLGRGGNDVLKGGGAGDQMAGGGGADRLIGGGGNDLIDGNAGHDVLIGGRGHDTFFFSTGDGHETVKDFDATDDAEKIDLSHAGGITGFHNLRVHHMSQVGANVVIDAGGGDVLTLAHVHMSDLQAADFIF